MSFTEESRYQYDLTPDSLVIDGGAYKGEWSMKMSAEYDCRVWAFEPVYEYFKHTRELLGSCPKISVFNAALGSQPKVETIYKSNTSSGKFSKGEPETVLVAGAMMFIHIPIDVFKINIEGGEYQLIKWFDHCGAILKNIKNIQVQWHDCVPEWRGMYTECTRILSETHTETWGAGPVWENWRLK
jgi:FkbM family methyltransferase